MKTLNLITLRKLLLISAAGAGLFTSAAFADPPVQTSDGPSTANGGALTSCASDGGLIVNCKPSDQMKTTPVTKPNIYKKTSPGSYGDNGNHGNDGGPGSGAPGGSGVSDQ